MPTRHRAQKHTDLGGNQVPYITDFEKNLKDAHTNSVQNGCDTFPSELVWFHIEAKPIWEKIQKHRKNVVIW